MAGLKYTVLFLSVFSDYVSASGNSTSMVTSSLTSRATSTASPATLNTSLLTTSTLTTSQGHTTDETGQSSEHSKDSSTVSAEPSTSGSSVVTLSTLDRQRNATGDSSNTTVPQSSAALTSPFSPVSSAQGNATVNTDSANIVAANPGLVAVLCIFFIVLALLVTIAIAKALSSRKPHFERLDDLPMNKMNEDSPFAKYPPK